MKKIFVRTKRFYYAFKECTNKILFLVLALTVFRIGLFIPLPGIDMRLLRAFAQCRQHSAMKTLGFFGKSVGCVSVFSLGIVPYVSASTVIQFLLVVCPALRKTRKEVFGTRKIRNYTRILTLLLGGFYAVSTVYKIARFVNANASGGPSKRRVYAVPFLGLLCGSVCVMWLSEQITKKGVGNGVSSIVFTNVVTEFLPEIKYAFRYVQAHHEYFFRDLLVGTGMFLTVFLIVFVERGQRRIPVNYVRRRRTEHRACTIVRGYFPIKVNVMGITPSMLSSTVMSFPKTMRSWITRHPKLLWSYSISECFRPGMLFYAYVYAIVTAFFCFFCTKVVFNAAEIAENLKNSGAYVPKIRPGKQTEKYIQSVVVHLTCFSAVYTVCFNCIPEMLRTLVRIPLCFDGISLLIVVEFVTELISEIKIAYADCRYQNALRFKI